MQEKAAVGADLYIEDNAHNIELLRAEGNQTIVFTNSTNEHLIGPRADTWPQALQLVLDVKKQWSKERQ